MPLVEVRRRTLVYLQCVLLGLAAWFVYAPVFHGEWLWDDNTDITGNSLLRDRSGLGKIWVAPGSAAPLAQQTGAQSWVAAPTLDYYPLKSTVQWLQWHWWGLDTFGYHLTNVILHLVSALLIWALLRRLGLRFAYWGALLFVVHPVAVESVAWIVELKNTLSLPLLLGAMIAYLEFDRGWEHVAPPYIASILLFLAAMLCKTSVAMFPVVILLYAWWKRGRIDRRDLGASAPFFAVSLVLGLVSIALHHQGEAASGIVIPGGILSRLAGAGLALAFYLWKCLVPVGLMPIYPRWDVDPPSAAQFLPGLAIIGLLVWLWRRRESDGRHLLLGLGFFALNLAPVLGLVRVSFMSLTWVMDHFAYISLIGVIGLAAAGLGALQKSGNRNIGKAANILAVMVILALAIESRGYARVFSGGEALWTYALRHNPDAWVAESNLASVLVDQGRMPEAIIHYRRSLALRPDNPETLNNLGNALLQTGRQPEAIAKYRQALRLKPDYFDSLANLGNALSETGQTAEAVESWTAASRLQPQNADLHNNLGCALAQLGRTEEARRQFEEALQLRPGDAQVRANLELLHGR